MKLEKLRYCLILCALLAQYCLSQEINIVKESRSGKKIIANKLFRADDSYISYGPRAVIDSGDYWRSSGIIKLSPFPDIRLETIVSDIKQRGNTYISTMRETPDGFESLGHISDDMPQHLVRTGFSKDCKVIYERTDSANRLRGYPVVEFLPGGAYVMGYQIRSEKDSNNGDLLFQYIDPSDSVRWTTIVDAGPLAGSLIVIPSIAMTQDGGVIALYSGGGAHTYPNVIKFSASGAVQWKKSLDTLHPDYSYLCLKVMEMNDRFYVLSNYYWNTFRPVIFCFTEDSTISRIIAGKDSNIQASDMIITPEGDYVLAGQSSYDSGDIFFRKYMVMRCSPTGEQVWQKEWQTREEDRTDTICVLTSVMRESDGSLVVGGYGGSIYGARYNGYFAKLTESPVSVKGQESKDDVEILTRYDVSTGVLHIDLPCTAYGNIDAGIFSLSGELISTFPEKDCIGTSVEYATQSLAKGLYLLQFSTGGRKHIQKILIE